MDQIAGRPFWPIHADQDGGLDTVGNALPVALATSKISDLFLFSHGWDKPETGADRLYQTMFSMIAAQVAAHAPAGAFPAIGFAGLYWPSMWFPDAPEAPTLTQLGKLLDVGEALSAAAAPQAPQEQLLKEFHSRLGDLVTSNPHAAEDAAEWATITAADPASAYTFLARTMGSTDPVIGDAQDLGDRFRTIWSGAKNALRIASYYEMKCRAGDVGRNGIGPLLERVATAAPGVRVHLIGHSFGARLVSFALAGISSPQRSPVASLSLIQGAFSHWSFAPSQPFGAPGALTAVSDRVHGPLICTYSSFDWALGRWYPQASLLANQDNQSTASVSDRWGAVGADGFRGVTPLMPTAIKTAGAVYDFGPGGFYSVDGQTVIKNVTGSAVNGAHSDIHHDEIAWLVVSAALKSVVNG